MQILKTARQPCLLYPSKVFTFAVFIPPPTTVGEEPMACGVTRVGVTLIFFPKKLATFLVITVCQFS